jgi:hypothetical protein
LNQKQILTKFVAELFDFEIAHATDCAKPMALSPSSNPRRGILYDA